MDKPTGIHHYEIVDHDDGTCHVRMVADNGEAVFWTETYVDRRDAMHAISLVRPATHDGEKVLRTAYSTPVPVIEVDA